MIHYVSLCVSEALGQIVDVRPAGADGWQVSELYGGALHLLALPEDHEARGVADAFVP